MRHDPFLIYCQQHFSHSPRTLYRYVRWIRRLCTYALCQHPTQITFTHIQGFLGTLTMHSPLTCNQAYAAIRLIYHDLLWPQMSLAFRAEFDQRFPKLRAKNPHHLPQSALDKATILAWLDRIPQQPHQLVAKMCYGSGLKLSEAVALRPEDLLLAAYSLQINGRITTVARNLVPDLHRQCQRARLEQSTWLFPSPNTPLRHISANAVQKALAAARSDDIPVGAGAACLRNSFMVHLLQAGLNARTVQVMAGIKTWQHIERFIRLAGLHLPKSPADFP